MLLRLIGASLGIIAACRFVVKRSRNSMAERHIKRRAARGQPLTCDGNAAWANQGRHFMCSQTGSVVLSCARAGIEEPVATRKVSLADTWFRSRRT
jgi:hypothetical protein